MEHAQGSKKTPSGRPGQVHFPFGQVTCPMGKDPGKLFGLIFDNDFERER